MEEQTQSRPKGELELLKQGPCTFRSLFGKSDSQQSLYPATASRWKYQQIPSLILRSLLEAMIHSFSSMEAIAFQTPAEIPVAVWSPLYSEADENTSKDRSSSYSVPLPGLLQVGKQWSQLLPLLHCLGR